MTNKTLRYLSLEWIESLTWHIANDQTMLAVALEHSIGVTQTVTGGPQGDVTYHLQVGNGQATFGAGAAVPEDVRFEEDWATSVAIATNTLNAQQAFITGRIRLYGDQQLLATSMPVFAALDTVFTTVRQFTQYC